MRHAIPALFVVMMVTGASAQPPATTPRPEPTTEAERATESAGLARKVAEDYSVVKGGAVLKLGPKSLLQWSNPVGGSIHGSVFVWTDKGRPEAVASVYKFYHPFHHLGVEFHSLALGPLTAKGAGGPAWEPAGAGVEFRPIPGAPAPAESPAQRLRQMRAVAKEFTAVETTRKDITRGVRLLTQPVYRDESTDPDVLDGALFAFVEGTDPDIFLAVEARRAATGKGFEWQYAVAPMNQIELRVSHRGREVWSKPRLPWEVVFDRRQPYTLILFKPGEGLNPAGPPDLEPGR